MSPEVFAAKTKNDWADRSNFSAVEGKYSLLEMETAKESDAEGTTMQLEESEEEEPPESALSEELQLLMGLICNKALLKETLLELDVDIEKFPLGKLSGSQVDVGYDILRELQEVHHIPIIVQSNRANCPGAHR